MHVRLHKQATITPKIRAEIQAAPRLMTSIRHWLITIESASVPFAAGDFVMTSRIAHISVIIYWQP